jgi:hypothetical protein
MTSATRVAQTELVDVDAFIRDGVDVDAFIRDGYVVVRGALEVGTAAACRAVIWDSMSGQGVREDDPATWPPLVEFDNLAGESFTAAGTSPALASACNELIGPGRWTSPVNPGGAVVVRQEEFAIDGSDPSPVARAIVAGLAMGRSIPPGTSVG